MRVKFVTTCPMLCIIILCNFLFVCFCIICLCFALCVVYVLSCSGKEERLMLIT